VIKRTVFFVSDQTGITAETMGHSLMTQFDGIEFRQVTVPFISTVDKAIEAVRKIDLVGRAGGRPADHIQHARAGRRAQRRARQQGIFSGFLRSVPHAARKELKTQSHHVTGTRRTAWPTRMPMRCASMRRISRWPTTTARGARLRARRRHPDRRVALRQDADLPVYGDAIRGIRGQLSVDRGRSGVAQVAARRSSRTRGNYSG
jgi:hypothetical protein